METDLQKLMAMQEQARHQIEEKLQAIQRDLFVRLVRDASNIRIEPWEAMLPPDHILIELAQFARRASVQYGKAVGFLKENKPAHVLKAEAGKIVVKQ